MTFPDDFPEHVKARFKYVRWRIDRFLKWKKAEPWPVDTAVKDGPGIPGSWDLPRFDNYTAHILRPLWQGLCDHAEQNPHVWSVDRIDSVIFELRDEFTIDVYVEKSPHIRGFADSLPSLEKRGWVKQLWSDMQQESRPRESPEHKYWIQFKDARARVAKVHAEKLAPRSTADRVIEPAQAAPHATAPDPPSDKDGPTTTQAPAPEPKPPAAAAWEDIDIRFLSTELVEIITKGKPPQNLNYAELGFEDRRSGKPNMAWVKLSYLAEHDGIQPVVPPKERLKKRLDWAPVQTRMQELRKALRKHFGISDDPVPLIDGIGYKTRFKISCSPSYET